MRMTERYIITSERYADAVLTQLIEYLEKEYNISIDEFDPFYEECNLEKFVELVFDEFPITIDTPNAEYDVEYCWNEFINSKDGRNAEDWITLQSQTYEISIIGEYLDNNLIAESVEDELGWFDEYFKINKDAKQLSKKDRDKIIEGFREGVVTTLSNGFCFNPDEYVEVVCAVNDEDGSTIEDLKHILGTQKQQIKNGYIFVRTGTYNPHLYGGADDIDFVYQILIGNLIYDAIRA